MQNGLLDSESLSLLKVYDRMFDLKNLYNSRVKRKDTGVYEKKKQRQEA